MQTNPAKQLADVLGEVVAAIEASPQVTKYRYDAYMAGIDRVSRMIRPHPTPQTYSLVAMAFCKAGANKQGVAHALKALGMA